MELKLTNSKQKVLIDDEDYERLKQYKWKLNRKGYATARGVGLMHRFLCGLQKGDDRTVHHVNEIKLDNRRKNLQVLTELEHIEIHKKKKEN